MIKDKSVIFSL